MKPGIKIIWLLLSLCGMTAHAQVTGDINFDRISSKSGLSSNEISFIFSDSRGFIWICTGRGLNRYDGIGFKKFFNEPGNPNSLPDDGVTSMAEDATGNLWIATKAGVSCYNPATGIFKNYLTSVEDSKKLHATVFSVAADRQHHIWVSSNFFLSEFIAEKNEFIHYPVDMGQSSGITRNYFIRALYEDHRGRLWLATSFGVKLFDRRTGRFTSFHVPEDKVASALNSVCVVREDKSGNIYAGTWGGGLLKFNEAQNRFRPAGFNDLEKEKMANGSGTIHDILFDQDQAYLATENGLVTVPASTLSTGVHVNDCRFYTYSDRDEKTIAFNLANVLCRDSSGTIWIGGFVNGLSKIDPRKQQFATVRKLEKDGRILGPTSFVRDINSPQHYFFGTFDMFHMGDTNRITDVGIRNYFVAPGSAVIWDIAAGNGYYWLATTEGLMEMNTAGKIVKKYVHHDDDNHTITAGKLWKVYADSKGIVWAGSLRHGISAVDPATGFSKNYFSNKDEPNSLFNFATTSFFEDSQSNIWFGAGNDILYCYNRRNDQFSTYPFAFTTGAGESTAQEPNPFMEDHKGLIWIGTDKGIAKFDPATTHISSVLSINMQLTNGNCMVTDAAGRIWMASSSGLYSYDTLSKKIKNFTVADGLESDEDINSLYKMPDGSILLGGSGYITHFDPRHIISNNFIPPVAITQIFVNGKEISPVDHFTLDYHSPISFEFASLSYSDAEKNRNQYMLQGADKTWTDADGRRMVTYANLPPGEYTFMVKGSNDDGLWNEHPAMISFRIATPFYRSWWFVCLCMISIVGGIYMLYRFRLSKALELQKFRMRIATDLHDDIGATLSSISMYSRSIKDQLKGQNPQLENVLEKMGNNSRDMVTGMSDMVWAINPDNDDGEKLQARMDAFGTDICAAKGILFYFDPDVKLNGFNLSPAQRKNIYLVFKEAMNNAVKYSETNAITVRLELKDKQLQLHIQDKGKGFDSVTVRSGNGMKNMQVRADEIKAILSVQSSPGKGTELTLVCRMH